MKKSTVSINAGIQSVLFCFGIYFVSLFLSIFICSSIFYAMHANKSNDIAVKELRARLELASIK